jgi:hypothetical protein
MNKFYLGALSFVFVVGFAATAGAVVVTLPDGETVKISPMAAQAITDLAAEADAAVAAGLVPAPVSSEGATSTTVTVDNGKATKTTEADLNDTKANGVWGAMLKVVNYRSSLNASIERVLDKKPVMAGAAFAAGEAFEVGMCSQVMGNDAANCAYHQGLNVGVRYAKDLTVNRWINNHVQSGVARFALKQVAGVPFSLGQKSLERRLGIRETYSLAQSHILGTIDGANYSALKQTSLLPGSR